jgi:hypothetical protein
LDDEISRRAALRIVGATAAAALSVGFGVDAPDAGAAGAAGDYLTPGTTRLRTLCKVLAALPQRRNFKALPMILTEPDQWESEALNTVLAFDGPRQLFDTTTLGEVWINQIRNTLNTQVFSLQQPNFLCVAVPHGAAALALFSQAAWNKYRLADRTAGAFKQNSFLFDPDFPAAAVNDPEKAGGLYSDAGNFIPTLQKRGVVFLGCHNAIWELAAALLKDGIDPDRRSHEELAADLTNSLIPGAISTPGNEAMIGKFQESGFVYSYA